MGSKKQLIVMFSFLTGMNILRQPVRLYASVTVIMAASFLFVQQVRAAEDSKAETSSTQPNKPKLDRSGKKQVGEASIYADKFANQEMADGNKMDPNDDNAAHKTLPLGTKAKVTNLETGKSTTVTIQDRGPFVKGRIIDLPPSKAEEIGLTEEEGVTKVEVKPLKIPPPKKAKQDKDAKTE